MQNYSYPIDYDWSHQEMKTVITMWNKVEQAYETGVKKEDFLHAYKAFKEVVPSKSSEKQFGNQFEKESGYSLYRVYKAAIEAKEQQMIRM